ncbi:MAG TPA: ATP-binding cassette domain-containing protein [Prolixibacteraceae bacterium]
MSVIFEYVSKFYGNQPALDNITFSVDSGTILGILGPNGAGKSTLLKIVAGYLRQSSGTVRVNNLEANPDDPAFKRQIGYLPENNPLYTDLYVREYLQLVAGLYKITNRNKRIGEMIELTGLGSEIHKKIGALSKGYRQRVGLAQALIHDPALLILDEPTAALDPAQLVEIRQMIRNISANKTVLLSTHIMQEVEAICNKVMILNLGKIVAMETPEKIKKISVQQMRKVEVEFRDPVSTKLIETLENVIKTERISETKYLVYSLSEEIRADLFRFAVKNKLTLLTLHEQESTMEKSFLEIIK